MPMGMGLRLPKSEGTRGQRRRDVVVAEAPVAGRQERAEEEKDDVGGVAGSQSADPGRAAAGFGSASR